MQVCVLSGSPKGEYSITLQTVLYLEKLFSDCTFSVVHVGQRIRSLEKDFSPVTEAVADAELILFCYPVYTFIAPSQLQRTIALMKASGVDISGKFAAQITTSKHFYDTTAHRYIEENCADMGLRYLGGLSADMEDLLKAQGRADAARFWRFVLWQAAQADVARPLPPKPASVPPYRRALADVPKTDARETVVVTDLLPGDASLAAMIADFTAASPAPVRVVNLREYPFSGGCLGCFHCAVTGKCVYKDGFDEFLRNDIQTAGAVVYAFTIRDHSMGARFKLFDDRQFCNGHRPVTAGMPVGYLINGDYAVEANLRMIVEGRADVGGNFLAGVATDAAGIVRLARTLHYALDEKLVLPRTFLGVGGMKIFRDLIYVMRGFMKADHKFYKQHKLYDFPQKQVPTILGMYGLGLLISAPKVQSKLGNRMNEGMLAPYKKVLQKAAGERLR